MNSRIGLLAGVGIVQLLFVAIYLFSEPSTDQVGAAFINFNETEIQAFQISEGENLVKIERGGDQWLVSGFLADATKASGLLGKISKLDAAWPVAQSEASAERFEVTKNKFQRKVTIFGEDDFVLDEFYLGTSPGYQRVHARRVDADEIYSVKLSNYEFGLKVDDWMDKTLIKVTGDVSEILLMKASGELGSKAVSLVDNDGGWSIDSQMADQPAVKTYLDRFSNLRVLGISNEKGQKVAELKLIVDGDPMTFTLFSLKDEEGEILEYVIESSLVEGRFRLASYLAEQILMTNTDLLPNMEKPMANAENS